LFPLAVFDAGQPFGCIVGEEDVRSIFKVLGGRFAHAGCICSRRLRRRRGHFLAPHRTNSGSCIVLELEKPRIDVNRKGLTLLTADLHAGEDYTIRISGDGYSRNMSFLEKNRPYTGGVGGGDSPHNHANIASLEVLSAPGRSGDRLSK
jgi:hypothetical protein